MRLDDMMQVLRDEFELAAADVDNALAAWMGDEPANAATHCEAVVATFERLASVSRMVGLEGQAAVIEQLRDAAMLAAMSDEAAMAAGLGWLALWREPLAASYATPGDADGAMALIEYLAVGPVPPSLVAVSELHDLLLRGPVLPVEDEEARAASFLMPLDDDVSIAVPEDIDAGLYETFLADAPEQLARLGDTVRALARGPVDVALLVEAQRVAHTFKGSGNIIGIRGIGRLAHRIEDLLDFAIAQQGRLPAAMARDLESATATLDQMVYALRGEEAEPADALQQLARLVRWAAAIDDGSWQALVAEPATALAAAVPAVVRSPRAAPATATEAAPEAEAQVRVAASRLGWMVRQAGQSLVQHGRLADRGARLEERLNALIASQQTLEARLRELQAQLDRQGVNLQEKAEQDGGSFDPLEMDRYNELHTLARFVAEMAADGQDLALSARDEARGSVLALSEHQRVLKAQHAELLRARLVPFRNITARLRRNVSQTAAATGKQVQLRVEGEHLQLDGDVLERLTEALLHLLRNAVDHGIESPEDRALLGKAAEGTVQLTVSREGQTIRIVCRDDGRGLDLPAIHAKALALGLIDAAGDPDAEALARTILLPGFSTRDAVNEVSGRGVGMDVVAERVRGMKGQLDIATEALAGTTFTLRVPATTGAAHALMVEVAGERFALPAEAVVVGVPAAQAVREGGRLVFGESSWRCASLATQVGLVDTCDPLAPRPAVVLRVGREEVALLVDRVIEARELILQDVGRLLRRVRGISSGALRVDGRVMFMLDPSALDGAHRAVDEQAATALRRRMQAERQRALVVDDSHSVRKTLSQLLGDAGYEVRTARDGFDALDQLSRQHADIVLTDLEMPNLNGLDLTRRLRESEAWKSLPVIMITSRGTDKHRAGATLAGVSAYLTKPYTDGELLGQVRDLLAA
jgi:chemosensory pili system protein ChpA (sensor histidine kinase/response regulator)